MPQILVDAELLRSLSTQVKAQVTELDTCLGILSRAVGDLDWEVRKEAHIDGDWLRARSRVYELTRHAEDIARYLDRRAQAFEEVDRDSSSAVGRVIISFEAAQWRWQKWWQENQPAAAFPFGLVDRLLHLGGLRGQAPAIWTAAVFPTLALPAGSVLSGHRPLRTLSDPAWSRPLKQAADQAVAAVGHGGAVASGSMEEASGSQRGGADG